MKRPGVLLLVALVAVPVASAYTVHADMPDEPLITFPPGGGHLNPKIIPVLNVTVTVGCEELRNYGNPTSSVVHFRTVFDLPDGIHVGSTDVDDEIALDRGPCSPLGTETLSGSKEFHVMAEPFVPALHPLKAEVDVVPTDDGEYPFPLETTPSSDDPAEFTVTVAFSEYIQATALDPVYSPFLVELPIHLEGWSSGRAHVSWRPVDGPEGLSLPEDVILESNKTSQSGSAETRAILPFTHIPGGPYQWVLEAIIRPASAMNDDSSYQRATPLRVTLSLDEEELASRLETYADDHLGPQPVPSVGVVPAIVVVGFLVGLTRRR